MQTMQTLKRKRVRPQKDPQDTHDHVGSSSYTSLQTVNEELYKKNVELAVKNKVLSLLHQLYEIATHGLDAPELAHDLTYSIAKTFNLPFVSIFTYDKVGKVLKPLTVASTIKRYGIKSEPDAYPSVVIHNQKEMHVCTQALFQNEQQQTKNFAEIVDPFFIGTPVAQLASDASIKTTLIYPLVIEEKELGLLILSLNRPYTELNTFEKESFVNIINIITVALDKSILYQELRQANLRLQELDRQKTEFLSIASHQLRTPLSIIKGYLELVRDGAFGEVAPKMDKVLGDMDESNERLVKLVDEFLDISRIEQGRTKYSFENVDMCEIVDSVLKEIHDRAQAMHVELVWKNKIGTCNVVADREKIRHVIFNYIDNATKYTPEGSVKIELAKDLTGVTCTVTDTGIGFEPEDEANFFQKFYRGKNVEHINVNGTGLGLFVCGKFIEAHSGRIWGKSKGAGKGGEFGFWIPAEQNSAQHVQKDV